MANKLMMELEQLAHYANEAKVPCKCTVCTAGCFSEVPFINDSELCAPCGENIHLIFFRSQS